MNRRVQSLIFAAAALLVASFASGQTIAQPGYTDAQAVAIAQATINSNLSGPINMAAGSSVAGSPMATTASVAAAIAAIPASNYLGAFTNATLPTNGAAGTCTSANYGKTAYVSDLGGGAGNVECDAGYWTPPNDGAAATVTSASGTINVNGLTQARIMVLAPSGGIFTGSTSVNIQNPYPKERVIIKTPATLGGLISSIGLNIGGIASGLSLTAGTTSIIVIGSDLSATKVQ